MGSLEKLHRVFVCSSGIQPLVDILETYGGWPVVKGDTWKSDDWNWLEIGQNISKEGLDSLIMETYVYTDLKNTSKRILSVSIEHFKHFSKNKCGNCIQFDSDE